MKNNTGKIVYYGHTPQKDISIKNNCINLDSGCFFTDVLRCVELKEKKLFVLKKGRIKVKSYSCSIFQNILKYKSSSKIVTVFKKIK